ncbi:MAG: DUF1588 domain-containing protein [Planctomycetota bacterium]
MGSRLVLLFSLVCVGQLSLAADEFESYLKPLFRANCYKCHGEKRVKGKVHLQKIESTADFLSKPKLIQTLVEVIDAGDMPPEDEPGLSDEERSKLLATLKKFLKDAASGGKAVKVPLRRLNRFQYNNAVRDLFRLNRDVFRLPEKLMTRHTRYVHDRPKTMPERVDVSCDALQQAGGLSGVAAFPKDLRAAHGFDNQADQLSLSPLLLEAFLRLSVSIVESPDFRRETVGQWDELFAEPKEGADLSAEVRRRASRFVRRAFRGAGDDETIARYSDYAVGKVQSLKSMTAGMKKLASAVLSSPLFLYRVGTSDEKAFRLASSLSFFLWGSSPDDRLLEKAASGDLTKPEALRAEIDRLVADAKIERFLDAFPAQWMQLENVLAATPDPKLSRYFHFDKTRPANLQMVLEPLLLFDAVFLENRPVVELIAPSFSYRSDLLKDWYTSDLKPPPIDEVGAKKENQKRSEHRRTLEVARNQVRETRDRYAQSLPELVEEKLASFDVPAAQAKWEAAQQEVLRQSVGLGTWHRIGPYQAGNFDEAHAKSFIDEVNADVSKEYGGKKWSEEKGYVDGKIHTFSGGNSSVYLYRVIQSGAKRRLPISIGSDDSFKIWLNGKLISDEKVSRGVAPNQNRFTLDLEKGENRYLMKVTNGGGGFGYYFRAEKTDLPAPVLAALQAEVEKRSKEQKDVVHRHYLSIAPELDALRKEHAKKLADLNRQFQEASNRFDRAPKPDSLDKLRGDAQRRYDEEIRRKLRARSFQRVASENPRYGGVITNAAMLSMTSGPKRTHPIARGAWIIEVIFNDPPPPPPNDVPPLNEDSGDQNLTIREKFAKHRENPDCAGCHSRLDPLGFALENFDVTGRWRDRYANGRDVDSSGKLLRKYPFQGIVQFKESLVKEERRFAKAFTAHLLRFALSRELVPSDALVVEKIVDRCAESRFRLRDLLREVVLSESFLGGE